MEEANASSSPQGKELFTQHGVLVKPIANWDDNSYGTLHIVDYPKAGLCVEWRPTDVSVFVDTSTWNQEDWAVVNTVWQTSNYNLSNSPRSTSSKIADTSRVVRIPVTDLKAFSVAPNGQHITFSQLDGMRHRACFQQCRAGNFVSALRGFVPTTRSKTEKNTYLIANQQDTSHVLNQSFAQLDLFTENKTDVVWKFVDNMQQRPYETTLQAFSKLTDFFPVYRPADQSRANEDIPAELLSDTVSEDSRGGNLDSYEFIVEDAWPGDEGGFPPPCSRLPPRQPVPRAEPLTAQRWAQLQDAEGRVTDAGLAKDVVFRGGVAHGIRSEVWKCLLKLYPWDSTVQERKEILAQKTTEYYQMKVQWRTMTPLQEQHFSDFRDRKSLIEKDVNRTDRNLPFYAGDNNSNLECLHDILMTYVMYNFDLGYVQGMNDLLSPLLMVLNKEVETFWCFVGFMDLVGRNFELDQAGMKMQLGQLHSLLDVVEPELASYLDCHESSNMYFCFRWLLVIFKREFSHADIMRLWEVLWTGLPCLNYHLLMCVALLHAQKGVLIENKYEFTEILKHINDLSLHIDLNSMLENAAGIHNQLMNAPELSNMVRSIVGLPLVEEAVPEAITGPPTPTNEAACTPDEMTESVTLATHLGEAAFERALNTQFL